MEGHIFKRGRIDSLSVLFVESEVKLVKVETGTLQERLDAIAHVNVWSLIFLVATNRMWF